MIQLKEKEFLKIAQISGISVHDIQKLYDMGIIHSIVALDYIIRKDFDEIKRSGKYLPRHIIARLAKEYCLSENRIKSAIYRKRNRCYYCTKCNKQITKAVYDRNNGLCDSCVADTIPL